MATHQDPNIAAATPDAASKVPPQQGVPPQPYTTPQYYYGAPMAQSGPPSRRPPLVSIVSPEDTKKIRNMQLVNFAFTMLQLGCSIAIILIVRYHLAVFVTRATSAGILINYSCYAATPEWQGTCDYAYSLASISIFFCFILSLMQCLTMDCCGMGRVIEATFDAVGVFWWVAGAATLGVRADEANAAGIPEQNARNAIVAMAAIAAFAFLVLLITNVVLIKRLGKAYKAVAAQQQQQQQQPTAQPAFVTMVPVPGAYPHMANHPGYAAQPGMPAPVPAALMPHSAAPGPAGVAVAPPPAGPVAPRTAENAV